MGRRAFATKEERFEFKKQRIHGIQNTCGHPGLRKCGVIRADGPPEPEVRTPAQRRYDAAMRDPVVKAGALRDRAKWIARAIRRAMKQGRSSVRTRGLSGNWITIARADMNRIARACEAKAAGSQ
jgi:hypothetical protein